jgi:hypothetical protein
MIDGDPVRIAMWSGPRNISTAMLRAWENRRDTHVWDEPLYAHYLAETGRGHPGRDETLAHHESDWRRVVADLTGPVPRGKTIFFQKLMAHHLLPDVDRDWLDGLTHFFLIREPREMLLSLVKKIPDPTLEETGLPQQVEIFERVRDGTGRRPPVLDSRDVLLDPHGCLMDLCRALEVPFDTAMLAWPPGRRSTDGAWAPYWYREVEASTGFHPYRPNPNPLPGHLIDLHEQCLDYYRILGARRLGSDSA